MKKSHLALILGYAAGIAMASQYLKKPKKDSDPVEEMKKDFMKIHKSAFNKFKETYWDEYVPSFLEDQKEALGEFVSEFKEEAIEKFEELKDKWEDLAKKGELELKKLYDHRKDYLDQAKWLSSDELKKAKAGLSRAYRSMKEKVKK